MTHLQVIHLSDAINELDASLKEHAQHGKPPGAIKLAWWPALSDKVGWLRRGSLTIFAGRPGDCKTAFFLSTAFHAAHILGQRVLYITLEELLEDVASRAMKAFSPKFQDDTVSKENVESLLQMTDGLRQLNLPIDIVAVPDVTPSSIEETLKLYPADNMPIVMIDYLGLMNADDSNTLNHNDLNMIILSLKKLMKKYGVIGLLAAQMKRDVDTRKTMEFFMSDIQGTSGAEQHTDRVVFLRRKQAGDDVNANLINLSEYVAFAIVKNRRGPVTLDPKDYIRLVFDPARVFMPIGDLPVVNIDLDNMWNEALPAGLSEIA